MENGENGRRQPTALILANGQLRQLYGKTAHGLIRRSSRFSIVGVIDEPTATQDAGEVLDGVRRGIPVFASLHDALTQLSERPDYCIIGCSVPGGRLTSDLLGVIRASIESGISIVNGMHTMLADDPGLLALARKHDVELVDVRRQNGQHHFWTGEILAVDTPRIAVLGTDCAVGKRTTAHLVRDACIAAGIQTELVTTGQTGWLQGGDYGFVLDAVPNDFVSGELEHAILEAIRTATPDLILLEGQSAFRNPSGPCGSEFIVSGGARAVILQHAPGRAFYEGFQLLGLRIPPVEEDVEIARLLGARTLAITLNGERMSHKSLLAERDRLQDLLNLPVIIPFEEGMEALVPLIEAYMAQEANAAT